MVAVLELPDHREELVAHKVLFVQEAIVVQVSAVH
jgi:hypothetical protein